MAAKEAAGSGLGAMKAIGRSTRVGTYVLFLLVFGEAFLWLIAAVVPSARLTLSNRFGRPPFMTDRDLGLRPNPKYGDHDAWGFRNDRVPSRVDIVALGDSQTYGVCARKRDAWPQRLSAATGLSCYNMACGTWAPPHYLLLLPRALSLHPSITLSAFYAGNDLWDAVYAVYWLRSLPEFAQDAVERPEMAELLRGALPVVQEASRRHAEILVPGFSGSRQPSPKAARESSPVSGFVREHSKLWGLARAVRGTFVPRAPTSSPALTEEAHWRELVELSRSEPGLIAYEQGQARTILNIGYRAHGFDPRIRDEGLRVCLESLRLVDERLRSTGTRHLVVLIPTKEALYYSSCPPEVRERRQFRSFVDGEGDVRQRTKAFLETRGILYVDVAPAMSVAIENGQQIYPYSSQSHPNSTGYGVIAAAVAEELHRLRWVPR